MTHGFKFPTEPPGIPSSFYEIASSIAKAGGDGLIMRYDSATSGWTPVNKNGQLLTGKNPNDYYGKPLVLLTNWSQDNESAIPDSGFTEAAADAFFASMVELDQDLGGTAGFNTTTGDFESKTGSIFNSPLHFIGFSRGAVVNSEIIQRLGTYFPEAGGLPGTGIRDLQMTTVDPHDFDQPGFSLFGQGFRDFHEPQVQVWENVTFADNYYQTVPELDPLLIRTGTPSGRSIPKADLDVFLGTRSALPNYENSRAGFTRETDPGWVGPIYLAGKGATHGRVLTWYSGTTNLGLTELPDAIYRRRGDGHYEHLFDEDFYNLNQNPPLNPWYMPDHANFTLGAADAPSEGIGTGWFYSVLGGGKDLRPSTTAQRVPITFDNTAENRMRGDYPVPTVFNGDFDVVTNPDWALENFVNYSNAIPGWSLHNNNASGSAPAPSPAPSPMNSMAVLASSTTPATNPFVPSTKFIELSTLATTYPSLGTHLANIGSTGVGDYVLEIRPGEKAVHNNMYIPETGMLRFDVFAPGTPVSTPGDVVKVFLDISSQSSELKSQSIFDTTFTTTTLPTLTLDTSYPAVDLHRRLPPPAFTSTSGSVIYENALDVQAYFNRIGYGEGGFETFLVDVPDTLRKQSARIRFVVEKGAGGTGTPVYIDNVAFGSVHLTAGNPTLNGDEAKRNASHADNYLVEKPQYALSYNANTKNANWVSWQLNKLWLDIGVNQRPNVFSRDITLTAPTFTANPDHANYIGSQFSRGHLTAASDRNRHYKDYLSTFIMSNTLPQPQKYNAGPWQALEEDLTVYARDLGKDIYIIAGGYGSQTLTSPNPLVTAGITIPSHLWKVALVLEKPDLDITTVSDSPGGEIADVFAAVMGNGLLPGPDLNTLVFPSTPTNITIPGATSAAGTTFPAKTLSFTAGDEPTFRQNWQLWRVPIDHIEALTGLDLLSSLPDDVENRIEANTVFTPFP